MPWKVTDFVVYYRNSAAATKATATLSIVFTPPAAGQIWRVESITCMCTSLSRTTFSAYTKTASPSSATPPAAGTTQGNLAFATFSPPLTVTQGNQLVLQWEGASQGAVAYARVQVQILSGTPGTPSPVAA